MYVCMSICNGFMIVYVPSDTLPSECHRTTAHGMEIEVEDSEDRRRCQNESRCMEDG